MGSEQNTLIFCAIVVYLFMITSFTYSWHKEKKLNGRVFLFFYYFLSPVTWMFSIGGFSIRKTFTFIGGIFMMAVLLTPVGTQEFNVPNPGWFGNIFGTLGIITLCVGMIMVFNLIVYGLAKLVIKFATNYSGRN